MPELDQIEIELHGKQNEKRIMKISSPSRGNKYSQIENRLLEESYIWKSVEKGLRLSIYLLLFIYFF